MSGSNPYAQTAASAASMSTPDLEAALKSYGDSRYQLTSDQHLQRGILALEYTKRVQPPQAQYNVTDPATGVSRPVTEWGGYDPAGASQASWQSLISGKPIPTVGAQPGSPGSPYDQSLANWNRATNQPGGPGAKVGYAPAMLHMEYDSTTGLPITNTPPGMAASHFMMGGPDGALWQHPQTFGTPPPGVQTVPGAPAPAAPGGQPARTSPLAQWSAPQSNALAQAAPAQGQPWWQNYLVG